MREYITSIGSRKKWFDREKNLKDGDIILVIVQTLLEETGKLGELSVYIPVVMG